MGRGKHLSWALKFAILSHSRANDVEGGREALSNAEKWAEEELNLEKAPSYYSILKILQNEEETTKFYDNGKMRKKLELQK